MRQVAAWQAIVFPAELVALPDANVVLVTLPEPLKDH
jgi:hypothetical protein